MCIPTRSRSCARRGACSSPAATPCSSIPRAVSATGPPSREIQNRDGLRAAIASLLWLVPNSIFELARMRIGPHYWDETQFAANLKTAGLTVLGTRRTFLNGASVLVWARRDVEES